MKTLSEYVSEFCTFILSNIEGITIIFALILTCLYVITESITHRKVKTELLNSFSTIVNQLASENTESQLSAAILLRRFLNYKLGFRGKYLFSETINVISSLLRTLPTGIYQKTLGDGLAYAIDLSDQDLQRTNLQDLYLGNKKERIKMNRTDLFMADLSHALLQNIEGHMAIFYNSILLNTQIKDCDFSNANFTGADLTNSTFKNVILDGASFIGAVNIPQEILCHLENGKFQCKEPVTTTIKKKDKTIFFSMPGIMGKAEELVTKEYKRILEEKGFDVIYYIRDNYPKYGQLNKIRESITKASGIIAFGFKQINIISGVLRPNTCEEEKLESSWLSTPWSDIEVGMAMMLGLPILLIHDIDITQGVFDNKLNECFIGKINLDLDTRLIERNPIFENWLNKVQ